MFIKRIMYKQVLRLQNRIGLNNKKKKRKRMNYWYKPSNDESPKPYAEWQDPDQVPTVWFHWNKIQK